MFRFTDLIIFQLTRDCNLNCKYCLMTEKSLYKGEIIDFEIYKKIIDRIIIQRLINERQDEWLIMNFHGGEPLIVGPTMIYKLADYATHVFKENGIKFKLGMQTNGTFITDEMCQVLNKFEISPGVSIDGLGKENDLRMKNSKEFYIEKFSILKNNNVPFGIMPVIHKKSIKKIPKMKSFLTKNYQAGMTANTLEDPYVDHDRDRSKLEISSNEYFKKVLLPGIKNEIYEGMDKDRNVTAPINKFLYDKLASHSNMTQTGCGSRFCGAGISMIAVHPDGAVHYCDRYTKQFKESFIENALDYDFLGIHQLKMTIDINNIKSRLLKETGCDNCRASYICSYGCLSMYYSTHNKRYGIDKESICNLYKKYYDYLDKRFIKIAKSYIKMGKPVKVYGNDKFISFKQETLDLLSKHNIYVRYIDENIYFYKRRKNDRS